jgi:hypothetical protein
MGGTLQGLSPAEVELVCVTSNRPIVTSHDNLQQIFGGGQGQFAPAEIIDDQKGHRS